MVERTATMGKAGAGEGDTLDDPTTRLEYDLLRWQRGEGLPAFVHTFAREEHGPSNPRLQETFTYSDGFGRVVQQKVQAEPGEVPGVPGIVSSRWVGTGRTVFNNKGNPVKQYEPFSATSDYEDESNIVEFGVTPIIHYDPLDRVIRTELPDGSESRVEFDAWVQRSFDPNDAITGTRWLTEHQAGSADEQRAATLTLAHANTPTTTHLDTLGRPFLVQADNGPDPATPSGPQRLYETRSTLDVEGNVLAIVDALGNTTIQQRFDVLQRRYRVQSPDAGTRLALADVTNQPLRSWDARGQTMGPRYDLLRRQTHLFVAQGAATERLLVRSVYGEALELTEAEARNLRGKPYQLYDCAGLVTNGLFDFKGNLRESTRRLSMSFQGEPDWYAARDLTAPDDILGEVDDLLEDEAFTSRTSYDALNRVVTHTTPDGSVSRPRYNEANLLEQLRVAVRGGPERVVINDIDYNARGQRVFCEYVDPTSATPTVTTTTTYEYDPRTFRLERLLTMRGGSKLQDLVYVYDAVGNIVALRNNADTAPFFAGTVVTGDGFYVYDAIYRLIEATGREHPGTEPVAFEPLGGSALPHPNDTQALSRYTETYRYDSVGNIEQIAHSGVSGWTRNYEYFPGTNRLRFTSVSGSPLQLTEAYTYDAHGSMTSMPHLPLMAWDYADRLKHTNRSVGDAQDTYFTYDGAGQRVRKVFVTVGSIKERIYLGGYELYRERANTAGSVVQLERQTLHVMDDTRRVALVETKTRESGSGVAAPESLWRLQLDNHLGSAMVELDHAASVISYEEYHPYGSTAFQAAKGGVEVSAKRYQYTGKERDEETGLYYHGARYYAPWLGRWTAVDPGGSGAGLNLFEYCRGNPIALHDPDGRAPTGVHLPPPSPGPRMPPPMIGPPPPPIEAPPVTVRPSPPVVPRAPVAPPRTPLFGGALLARVTAFFAILFTPSNSSTDYRVTYEDPDTHTVLTFPSHDQLQGYLNRKANEKRIAPGAEGGATSRDAPAADDRKGPVSAPGAERGSPEAHAPAPEGMPPAAEAPAGKKGPVVASAKDLEIPAPEKALPPALAAKREAIIQKLKELSATDPTFEAIRKLDSEARIGIQGSIVRGIVGNPRKETYGGPFNPEDFDLDLFVVSAKLPQSDKVVPTAMLRDRIYRTSEKTFEGLRPGGKGVSIKVFRPNETIPGPRVFF